MDIEIRDYKVVGPEGDYQVMEYFGAYRLSKKKFKSLDKALAYAKELQNKRDTKETA